MKYLLKIKESIILLKQETERFINILNRAGEIQSYQATLMYYLYNNSSVDRIMDLIEQINKDMQIITYETRMILVSFEDVSPLIPLSNLNDNVFHLGTEICVHASKQAAARPRPVPASTKAFSASREVKLLCSIHPNRQPSLGLQLPVRLIYQRPGHIMKRAVIIRLAAGDAVSV